MTPLPQPAPDPRNHYLVPDYAGMEALVADLVVPANASMYVMSALETSRELIRHSYYRYEFATVAVSHSLFALEHLLTERLATHASLQDLITRATTAGLIAPELAAELDRSRQVRDGLARGTRSSAVILPLRAIDLVRTVFDAVSLLLPTSTPQPEDRLAQLWDDHERAPYPDGFRGIDIAGVELILLDADTAGLVRTELNGGLDENGIAGLWWCIAGLDKVVPLIDSEYCASYFANLRTLARLTVARHLPSAT
ncbi:hypothetical protein ACFVXG_01640 [Kitasatospora sp. NPDC058162]|uniref:hypothetical protein n=1 Tax=Kitasatospora sp. NPDC058162 TaxID=3346362 RepID=UPI0036D8D1F6